MKTINHGKEIAQKHIYELSREDYIEHECNKWLKEYYAMYTYQVLI